MADVSTTSRSPRFSPRTSNRTRDPDTLGGNPSPDLSLAEEGIRVPTGNPPKLFHRVKHSGSVLSLVVSDESIYVGTQNGEISVWSLATYGLLAKVSGHRGSVLCLHLSRDGKLLFSSAGDAIVNVWRPNTLERLFSIYSTYDVGDIFCVAYSSSLQTAYFGAQNTSIQWYDLRQRDSRPSPNPIHHPSHRNHRFFDSLGPGGISTPRPISPDGEPPSALGGQHLEIDNEHIIQYAHYGYVYCILLTQGLDKNDGEREMLISGGGDGSVKLWSLDRDGMSISAERTLENGDSAVLSMAMDGTILYCGLLQGDLNVWDLDTRQLVRSVKAHTEDVLTISVGGGFIFSAGASGIAKKWNHQHRLASWWQAHKGLILASAMTVYHGRQILVTGGNDNDVAVWDISHYAPEHDMRLRTSNEQLHDSLAKFIGYRTVSSNPQYAEDCRRGATFLRTLFRRFGAVTEMFNTEGHLNPVVFAEFKGNHQSTRRRKRILFYGHYDVIAAENECGKWAADPFTMQPTNGYVYGRGASDNKGPVLAALYAAAELLSQHELDADILFVVEGEEECGSRGFEKAIKENKGIIGQIDYILLANSYWLDDDVPCLTYGLRGVIHATITVESDQPDLHSGVDGSSLLDESLKDLVMILAKLNGPHGEVRLPAFYDPILQVTEAERERYADITRTLLRRNPALGDTDTLTASLMQRWREASLTIHRFKVSGPENSTIIPRRAQAAISLRLVPNQETSVVKRGLIDFLTSAFEELGSKNRLTIRIDREAEPWLGDPENAIFRVLEEAIIAVWGPTVNAAPSSSSSPRQGPLKENSRSTTFSSQSQPPSPATSSTLSGTCGHNMAIPSIPSLSSPSTTITQLSKPFRPLYIREGGSIPSIRFLEKEFSAPAAHLPCGQASDSAHLDNERLRLVNLYNSREIFKRVFGIGGL